MLDVLTALGARVAAPVAAAAAYALPSRSRSPRGSAAAVRLHARVAAAVHARRRRRGRVWPCPRRPAATCTSTSARCAPALTAHGVGDAQELEDFLTARLGMPAPGGHRFGDDLGALRVRLSTGPLLGGTDERARGMPHARPRRWNCHTCNAR